MRNVHDASRDLRRRTIVSRWVPCAERMPPKYQEVSTKRVVGMKESCFVQRIWCGDGWMTCVGLLELTPNTEPTHWQEDAIWIDGEPHPYAAAARATPTEQKEAPVADNDKCPRCGAAETTREYNYGWFVTYSCGSTHFYDRSGRPLSGGNYPSQSSACVVAERNALRAEVIRLRKENARLTGETSPDRLFAALVEALGVDSTEDHFWKDPNTPDHEALLSAARAKNEALKAALAGSVPRKVAERAAELAMTGGAMRGIGVLPPEYAIVKRGEMMDRLVRTLAEVPSDDAGHAIWRACLARAEAEHAKEDAKP